MNENFIDSKMTGVLLFSSSFLLFVIVVDLDLINLTIEHTWIITKIGIYLRLIKIPLGIGLILIFL